MSMYPIHNCGSGRVVFVHTTGTLLLVQNKKDLAISFARLYLLHQARTFVDVEDIMADLNLHWINGKDKMQPPYSFEAGQGNEQCW